MRVAPLAIVLIAPVVSEGAQDPSPLVHETVVEAPVEQVWAAWTTSAGLRAWLAPHADFELRLGGKMRANYQADGVLGDAGTIENTILAFEPQRMLAIKVTKAPAGFPFPNAVERMWTVLYFTPASATRTHVRVVSLGFGSDAESRGMRDFFAEGNAATLSQLQALFQRPR